MKCNSSSASSIQAMKESINLRRCSTVPVYCRVEILQTIKSFFFEKYQFSKFTFKFKFIIMSSRLPKMPLTKPLSQYDLQKLINALRLKPFRVQKKHIVRAALMFGSELLQPKKNGNKRFNSKTGLPCYSCPSSNPNRITDSLLKMYQKLHPKMRHAITLTDSCYHRYFDQEFVTLLDRMSREDPCRVEFQRLSEEDRAARSIKMRQINRAIKGKEPMPPPSNVQKECWAFIDAFPDSDSDAEDESEDECEFDEADPCQACFPEEYAAINTPNSESDNEQSSETDASSDTMNDHDSGPVIDPNTNMMKPEPDVESDYDDNVKQPPTKKMKLTDSEGYLPRMHRCSRGRLGCHSEHDEDSVPSSKVNQLIDELCEKADQAKLQGEELKVLQDQLAKKQHTHAMAYENLAKCAETMLCKTKPQGGVFLA